MKYQVTHHSVPNPDDGAECAIGDVIELNDAEFAGRIGKVKKVREAKVEVKPEPKKAEVKKSSSKAKPKSSK